MPIVARQPGSPPPTVGRSGGAPSTGGSGPSEDLLPLDGTAANASALAPHRALALDALHVLRILRDHPRDAGPWGVPAFAREVDQIRAQLDPIRDRRGLAASFGREAFRSPMAGLLAMLILALADNDIMMAQETRHYTQMTALALLHFQRRRCDIAVIEVGLGGRLDATNVIFPFVDF